MPIKLNNPLNNKEVLALISIRYIEKRAPVQNLRCADLLRIYLNDLPGHREV